MDSRPGDEMLLLAVAERDMGAFRALYDRHAVLQARAQAAFLVLAAASFSIFLVRRRRLAQLRPWR
jgi:hypothetical protein